MQFRAKQPSQIGNAIFHVTLFAIFSRFFSQIGYRVAGPYVSLHITRRNPAALIAKGEVDR